MDMEVQNKSKDVSSSSNGSKTSDQAQTSKDSAQFEQASSNSSPKPETMPAIQNTISSIKGSPEPKEENDDNPPAEKKADREKSSTTPSDAPKEETSFSQMDELLAIDEKEAKTSQLAPEEDQQKVNASLLESAKHSKADINALIENHGEIFTTNASGEIALKPVIVEDTVRVDDSKPLDDAVLQRMQARIQLNDRANAYLELYNATGEEQLILQTQITTYTGAIGSMALVGNMLAKDANPEKYNLSLDQFSLDILQGTHDLAKQFVGKPVYNLDRNSLQDADHAVWQSKGMGEHFPGNVQFRDYGDHSSPELAEAIYNTQGTANSLQMGQEFNMPASTIKNIGNRPAEFIDDSDKYSQVNGDRFISVIEKNTGHIVAFWDKRIQLPKIENPTSLPILFNQIPNAPRSEAGNFEWHSDTMTLSTPWDDISGHAIRDYLKADNPQIPASNTVESKNEFAQSHSLESLMLDIIRYEVRDEDLAFWIKQQ